MLRGERRHRRLDDRRPKAVGEEKLAIVSQDLEWMSCERATPWRRM